MEIQGNRTRAIKPIARCYTRWAIPTVYPPFTSPHWNTFLTSFWIHASWRGKPHSSLQVTGSSQRWSYLQKRISRHLFLFSWTLFSNSDFDVIANGTPKMSLFRTLNSYTSFVPRFIDLPLHLLLGINEAFISLWVILRSSLNSVFVRVWEYLF
jgi:hypothetical protein